MDIMEIRAVISVFNVRLDALLALVVPVLAATADIFSIMAAAIHSVRQEPIKIQQVAWPAAQFALLASHLPPALHAFLAIICIILLVFIPAHLTITPI
jgi:hypothetical protein